MLDINKLSIRLGEKKTIAVDQSRAYSGKITGIVGPNGAGKSTLLKAIVNDIPSQGIIQLHEDELTSWRKEELAKNMAYLPQSSELTFFFTAREVVELGAIPLSLSKAKIHNEIQRLMKLTDCIHLADQPFPLLSGGEKQRIHLARVLLQLSQASYPPLLLLDEPLAALDLGQQHHVMALLNNLTKERNFIVVIVIHDLNHALRYCDSIWLMQNGTMIGEGDPTTVLSKEQISNTWQYPAQEIMTPSGCALIY